VVQANHRHPWGRPEKFGLDTLPAWRLSGAAAFIGGFDESGVVRDESAEIHPTFVTFAIF
jgi:hypothetical protein